MCYENRNQAVLLKINAITPVTEMLKDGGYIAENFDANPIFDSDMDGLYWESVGIISDGVIDLLNDAIEQKEAKIVDAIENGEPYDDEYWEETSTMSEMDKWMWILDEQEILRDFVAIRDVTGSQNPYKM